MAIDALGLARRYLAQVSLLGANFANFRGFSAREAA